MFAASRAFASIALLVASLSGHGASGVAVAHLAVDHAARAAHDHPHGEPAGEHHDHDADHDADPATEHSHELTLASAAPARVVGTAAGLIPIAVVPTSVAGRPHRPWTLRLPPSARPEIPSPPKRHSILLI